MQDSGAIFDPTGCYRYRLWRVWHRYGDRLAFVLLNPSTADATTDDPTLRRCIAFARAWGYGGVTVVNLFAYRTPHPAKLRTVAAPVGPENDGYILQASQNASLTVLAWGNNGRLQDRDRQVTQLLQAQPWGHLGLTQQGQPRHPLYLPKATQIRRLG